MKQPHTEAAIEHTDDQQNTGNHLKPGNGVGGSDKFGGTRAGAENVEAGKAGVNSNDDIKPSELTGSTPSDDKTS